MSYKSMLYINDQLSKVNTRHKPFFDKNSTSGSSILVPKHATLVSIRPLAINVPGPPHVYVLIVNFSLMSVHLRAEVSLDIMFNVASKISLAF